MRRNFRWQPGSHQIDALALFTLFLAVYLLSFKGIFTAVDELALCARTESLVQWGNFDVPQLYFATFHNPVGAQEVGFPLLAAPFYWLAQQIGALHRVQVVMLLNPLATAVIVSILYLTGRQLGYGRNATLIAAFAFGLASLAWASRATIALCRLRSIGLTGVAALKSRLQFSAEDRQQLGRQVGGQVGQVGGGEGVHRVALPLSWFLL
jgi:hypothetical protein